MLTAFLQQHLAGIFGMSLAAVLAIVWAFRYQSIAVIVLVAFVARAGATLFHTFVMSLPDGISDAVGFEYASFMWSLNGLGAALDAFGDRGMSYIYSNVGSLVYVFFGRDALLLQSLSVIAGVFAVILTYKLALRVWEDENIARKAAWAMALFPVMVMYSALTMREPFIVVLFLAGLIYVVKWAKSGSLVHAGIAVVLFFSQVVLHAGMAVAGIAFAGVVVYTNLATALARFKSGYIRVVPVFATVLVVVVLAASWYELAGLKLPYVGNISGFVNPDVLIDAATIQSRQAAGSLWPAWMVPSSVFGVVWATPVRSVYLLFAPFPWDIRSPNHIIGLLDGLLYIALAWWAFRNRALLMANRSARIVILLLLPLIVAFAWGTGNFGTGLRHRVKLVGALIVLAGPRLPKIVWRRTDAAKPAPAATG